MENRNKLDLQIKSAYKLIDYLKGNNSIENMKELFVLWRKETEVVLNEVFEDNKLSKRFMLKTDTIINTISKVATKDILIKSITDGISFIEEIELDNESYKIDDSLSKASAIVVIKRILQNFYKHIQVMYQDEVHNSGTIKKSTLDEIQIGNEYDVQRILYSLIRPIFPTARTEVSDDVGYKGIRYDIKIDEYNIVIEVKCTRKSMTERNLTEELGSDAFHYNAEYVFFFIYDKESIIKNVDAFVKRYKREKNEFSTKIEAIVNQSITI